MKPSNFDKIIFDMDGVITSEYMYWDTAALTVYEILFSGEFYGSQEIDIKLCMENVSKIHNIIFNNDKTIKTIKKLGVNTNWDLAYIVFCISKYLDPQLDKLDINHFKEVCKAIEKINILAPDIYTKAEQILPLSGDFKRGNSEFWSKLQNVFQHWFLGTDEYKEIYGEPINKGFRNGLISFEKPVIPIEKIKQTLSSLNNKGIKLGIGTGRPITEIYKPLEMWGINNYFDKNYSVTYTDVVNAEEKLGFSVSLAKPHPFVFLKSAFGSMYTDSELINNSLNDELTEKVLIVGDAPSDFLAAKEAGFKFAAVLTGVSGKDAKDYFEENNADYILNDMSELINVI